MWNTAFTRTKTDLSLWESESWLLALYEVTVSPDRYALAEILVEIGTLAGARYNRVSIQTQGKKRAKCKKIENLSEITAYIVSEPKIIELISVEQIFEDDFTKSCASVSIDLHRSMFTLHLPAASLDDKKKDVISIAASKYFLPRYGFSHTLSRAFHAMSWPRGVGDISFDHQTLLGLSALARAVSDPSHPLCRLLHDVYRSNILSMTHLSAYVGSDTMLKWIKKKSYGEIEPITDDLFLWKMTETVTQLARSELLAAGALLPRQ